MTEAASGGERPALGMRVSRCLGYCAPCVVAVLLAFAMNFFQIVQAQEVIHHLVGDLGGAPAGHHAATDGGHGAATSEHAGSEAVAVGARARPADAAQHAVWQVYQDLRRVLHAEQQHGVGQLARAVASLERSLWQWVVPTLWGFLACATLFPFVVLGVGVASARRPLPHPLAAAPARTLLAFVVVVGWLFVLNPLGQRTTALAEALRYEPTADMGGLPAFVAYPVPVTAAVAAFLGWYLHFVSLAFYRYFRADAAGSHFSAMMVKRFLFVYGVGLVLSPALGGESVLLPFLLGFLPLSATQRLKAFATKKAETEGPDLTSLPALGTWEAVRLTEEGVDSVGALAMADAAALARALPYTRGQVQLWVDTAQLVSLLGGERYARVRRYALTASEFIARAEDPAFQGVLREECQIANAVEIARLLRSTYQVTRG